MISHLSETLKSETSAPLPNQSFSSWVRSNTGLFISQLLGSASFLAALLYYVTRLFEHHETSSPQPHGSSQFKPEELLALIDYAHIAFVIIFIIALIRVLDDNERGEYRVGRVLRRVFGGPQNNLKENELTEDEKKRLEDCKNQLGRFKVAFLWFWFSILVLYIVFAFKHNLEASDVKHNLEALVVALPFITFALNNISLFFIFSCFLILYDPSHAAPPRDKSLGLWASVKWAINALYKSQRFWPGVVLMTIIALFPLLAYFDAKSDDDVQNLAAKFFALSGVLNAVVLALLIARLDSKLIGLRSWLTGLLYLYSAVQPFFAIFEQTDPLYKNIQASVLIVAFILKIYFFLIVMYILQTGRMLNYLFCFPTFAKRVRPIFGNGFLPNMPLRKWLGGSTFVSLSIGVFCSLRLVLFRFHGWDWKHNFYFAHIVLLFIIVLIMLISVCPQCFPFLSKDESDRSGVKPESSDIESVHRQIFNDWPKLKQSAILPCASMEQVKQFKRYFLYFWVATLALYVSLAIKEPVKFVGDQILQPKEWVRQLSLPFLHFLFNNLETWALFCCFAVLLLPSYKSGSEKYREESQKLRKLLVNYARLATVVLIASFPLLLFLFNFSVEASQTNLGKYSSVFNTVSGTLNAVVLALLIARLNSRLMGLHSFVILLLYFYSAIQPFFVLFDLPGGLFQDMLKWVLAIAFVLKICFFLVVSYALETRRVLNYFICVPFLNTRVNSIFDNQFEIKTYREGEHSFKFSITRKGLLVYFTDTSSSTRRENDRKIDRLRTLMESPQQYRAREICGTHWIEVRDFDILCQSTGLRSEDEVADLKEESIEKIPYCKYDRG